MKNITLAIDEGVLREVRKYAAGRNTTVNALVREHLEQIARQVSETANARAELARMSEESTARLGPDWKWSREQSNARPILSGHEHPDLRGSRKGSGRGKKKESA